jgi:RimJ/RimL family protein N-acetyltransferase
LKAKRVEINCEEDNVKSSKVAIILNYDLEGTLRNHRLNASGQKVTQSLIYSCIDIAQLPPMLYHWD